MKAPRTAIAKVLADHAAKPDFDAKKFSRAVAKYLMDENRTSELNSVLRDVIRERAERGMLEVTAISAHELSDSEKASIRDLGKALRPQTQKTIIDENHDPAVIGGIRLEFPDKLLDRTVRAKLNRFSQLTTKES